MRLSLKLSIAFCVAAAFLLSVEVTAVFVIVRVNSILNDVKRYDTQLDQVAIALSALRTAPGKNPEHLARLDDLARWADGDAEARLIAETRQLLSAGSGSVAAAGALEQLSAYYRKANQQAHDRLIRIHERVVLGLIAIMINSILLFVLLTYLMRYWLLNPIHDLGESLAVIAGGNLQARVVSRAGREFDAIAAPVNALTASLLEAQERIERAEQLAAIGEACTHVTHSLRTQLTSIRSLAQYESRASDVDPAARIGFNYIIATVNKLDGWVRDLTASVRPLDPHPVKQQLEPIIQDTVALLEPRLTEKGIKVEFKPADNLPLIPLDRGLFEQALSGVLVNAIEASPDQGRIAITTSGQDGWISIRIEDVGPGMSDDAKQRAFEAFFTTKPDNAGLGLTIAKSVITRHGGDIKIDSAAGKGTRVTMRLPTAKTPSATTKPQ